MHRTTTSATLLVTVALSALTGCVTVPPPPVSRPPTAPVQPSAPRPDGRAKPRIVQAPAHEALERVAPTSEAAPRLPATRRPTTPGPGRAQQPPAQPHPRSPHSEPSTRQPGVDLPALPDRIHQELRDSADVCALGKKYGGWHRDSPEATICRLAQGR